MPLDVPTSLRGKCNNVFVAVDIVPVHSFVCYDLKQNPDSKQRVSLIQFQKERHRCVNSTGRDAPGRLSRGSTVT